MGQLFANNATAILQGNISAFDTQLTVTASLADLFRVATTSNWGSPLDWYKVTLGDNLGNTEIVKVGIRTLGSGILSNMLRGQDNTTARNWNAGANVSARLTAADLTAAVGGVETNAAAIAAETAAREALQEALQNNLAGTGAGQGSQIPGHNVALTAVAGTIGYHLNYGDIDVGGYPYLVSPTQTATYNTTQINAAAVLAAITKRGLRFPATPGSLIGINAEITTALWGISGAGQEATVIQATAAMNKMFTFTGRAYGHDLTIDFARLVKVGKTLHISNGSSFDRMTLKNALFNNAEAEAGSNNSITNYNNCLFQGGGSVYTTGTASGTIGANLMTIAGAADLTTFVVPIRDFIKFPFNSSNVDSVVTARTRNTITVTSNFTCNSDKGYFEMRTAGNVLFTDSLNVDANILINASFKAGTNIVTFENTVDLTTVVPVGSKFRSVFNESNKPYEINAVTATTLSTYPALPFSMSGAAFRLLQGGNMWIKNGPDNGIFSFNSCTMQNGAAYNLGMQGLYGAYVHGGAYEFTNGSHFIVGHRSAGQTVFGAYIAGVYMEGAHTPITYPLDPYYCDISLAFAFGSTYIGSTSGFQPFMVNNYTKTKDQYIHQDETKGAVFWAPTDYNKAVVFSPANGRYTKNNGKITASFSITCPVVVNASPAYLESQPFDFLEPTLLAAVVYVSGSATRYKLKAIASNLMQLFTEADVALTLSDISNKTLTCTFEYYSA